MEIGNTKYIYIPRIIDVIFWANYQKCLMCIITYYIFSMGQLVIVKQQLPIILTRVDITIARYVNADISSIALLIVWKTALIGLAFYSSHL